ncbi:MAG: hypothetical protein ICV79_08320 [Flavisolibacter sp.]|nr:hypothetical protein [Flavisolibacter sp.]
MRQLATSLQIAAITLLLLISSCKKPSKEEKKDEGPGTLLYQDVYCGVTDELFWLNNENILIGEPCSGTLKKVNVSTKSVELIRFSTDNSPMRSFYSQQLPNTLFYVAFKQGTSGSFPTQFSLYARNLTTGSTATVMDSLPGIASPLIFFALGNKKLAYTGYQLKETFIIDLERSTLQKIPLPGHIVQAFSPDDKQMLMHAVTRVQTNDPLTITGSFIYDFACQCLQPLTPNPLINTYYYSLYNRGNVFWRPQGIYAYTVTDRYQYNIKFLNLTTNTELTSFLKLQGGPWVSSNSTLAAVWVQVPNTVTSAKLILHDLATQQTKELFTAGCCNLAFNSDVTDVIVSPDGKKIAFAKGGALRIIAL